MSGLIFSPLAEQDLIGIADYIGRDKPDAARRWVQKLRAACEHLAAQSEMGELRSGLGIPDCRIFSVGDYVIFFRRRGAGIEVARIIHGSRDLSQL